MRLGIEEVNGKDFDQNHDNVHDQVLPTCIVHTDWVDKGGEEAGATDEELLDRNTTGSFGVWEQFHKVGWNVISYFLGLKASEDLL